MFNANVSFCGSASDLETGFVKKLVAYFSIGSKPWQPSRVQIKVDPGSVFYKLSPDGSDKVRGQVALFFELVEAFLNDGRISDHFRETAEFIAERIGQIGDPLPELFSVPSELTEPRHEDECEHHKVGGFVLAFASPCEVEPLPELEVFPKELKRLIDDYGGYDAMTRHLAMFSKENWPEGVTLEKTSIMVHVGHAGSYRSSHVVLRELPCSNWLFGQHSRGNSRGVVGHLPYAHLYVAPDQGFHVGDYVKYDVTLDYCPCCGWPPWQRKCRVEVD